MNSEKILKSQILQNAVNDIVQGDTVLRPKQHEAFVKMADKELFEISDGYFRLPTAFGKTVMFSLMARAFLENSTKKGKIIIFVPRLTLIGQTVDTLREFTDIEASTYTSKGKDTSANIIISTYASADRLFSELKPENIDLIIADEAHHAIGEKTSKIMQRIAATTPIVGFTATPTFSDDHALGDLLSTELYTLSIEDCVKNGLLSPVKNILYRPSLNFNILNAPIKSGQGADFDYKKLGRIIKMQTLISEIAKVYLNESDGDNKFSKMRAIINCPNIEIADKQAKKLNELAGKDIAISVHSDQKDFQKRVDAFLDKEYRIVCQVNTLTEGLDDSSVELCINYPSYSPVKIEQSGGRALRLNDKKPHKMAYVMDTVFRATDGEALETSLQRAFVAGQVLYRDVAGEFVVMPDERLKHYAKTSKTKTKRARTAYDITTDAELLKQLNPHYKQWEKDLAWKSSGFVPPVDELHDMSPKYLSTKLFNPKTIKKPSPREVVAKMQWMQPSMPYAIRLRRTINNRKVLHLRDTFFNKFIQDSGFELIVPKTKRDISAADLVKNYYVEPATAKSKIIRFSKQIGAKYKLDPETGRFVLCFTKKHLDTVAKHWKPRQTPLEHKSQNKDYIGVWELSQKHIDAIESDIKRALQDIYVKANENQTSAHTKRRTPHSLNDAVIYDGGYRLHKDFIDKFCKKAHFTRINLGKNDLAEKLGLKSKYPVTSLWKTEKQLVDYIYTELRPEKLHSMLESYGNNYPARVKVSTDYKSRLLNLAYLDDFCKFALFTKEPLPLKTDSWKTAAELSAKYIDASAEDISNALKKLSGDEEWVLNGSISTMMNTETDSPEPCLHIVDIGYFAKTAGLQRKKKKLDIKTLTHGTEMVNTLYKMGIRKNRKNGGHSM